MAAGLAGRAAELLPGEKGAPARFVRGKANLVEREFFIGNLLVRIHLIIKMILVDLSCAMKV